MLDANIRETVDDIKHLWIGCTEIGWESLRRDVDALEPRAVLFNTAPVAQLVASTDESHFLEVAGDREHIRPPFLTRRSGGMENRRYPRGTVLGGRSSK